MRAAPLIALACAACAGGYGGGGRPAAAPAPAPANAVTYAPGVTRYRSASHQHVERRLGSQDQSNDAALVAYVSATVATGGAGLQVTFTVDSVPTYVTGLPGATGADAARGATFSGTLARDGTIAALAGEGGGVPLTPTAVSQHVVAAPRDTLGTRALPIETRTTYTFTGTGSQGGEPFSVQGTGQRHTTELLDVGGRFLGLTAADTSSYTIALKAADLSIPAHETRADTVSVIR